MYIKQSTLQFRARFLPSQIKYRTVFARSSPSLGQHGRWSWSQNEDQSSRQDEDQLSLQDKEDLKLLEKRATSSHFRDGAHYSASSSGTSSIATSSTKGADEHSLPHPIWSEEEAERVKITHKKPEGMSDRLAYVAVSAMRWGFDLLSGYSMKNRLGVLSERDALKRCIFLETVAGVPGMAAAAGRHFQSLRMMKRDHGWIHTLLEEAENERMHLMTFMQLRQPGMLFRAAVISTQFVFTALFCFAYLINPNFCHRFVGYLEEQAVITYSHILVEIDSGHLPLWTTLKAPQIAIEYWKLPFGATMRDVILVIRADEAHHRLVNHTLGSLNLDDENPFKPGQ